MLYSVIAKWRRLSDKLQNFAQADTVLIQQ
jgi:hypothetical protein